MRRFTLIPTPWRCRNSFNTVGNSVEDSSPTTSRAAPRCAISKSECYAGIAECLFLSGRPLGVVLGKAVDGSFLDSAFFTFLIQPQPRVDTILISGLFGQTMIRGPTAIPIGNEANVTRDIVFRHCKPHPNLMWGHTIRRLSLLTNQCSGWFDAIQNT